MARSPRLLTLSFVVSSVAACGGPAAPAPTGPQPGAGAVGGPPYAALFQDGATLRYAFVSESSMYDPDDPKANEAGQVVDRTEAAVSCTVQARQLGTWQAARLSCTPPAEDEAGQELTAVYVANATGVWRTDAPALPADDTAAAALATGDMLLAATPVADEKRQEEEEGFGSMRSVAPAEDGGWCAAWGSWGGDEGGGSACFAAGRGLTKVTWYFAGGSTRDVSYTLTTP